MACRNRQDRAVHARQGDPADAVADRLSIEAYGKSLLVSAAGAFVYGDDVGIGGTYTHNQLIQKTLAYVSQAAVTAESTDLYAHTDNRVIGVAASAAASARAPTCVSAPKKRLSPTRGPRVTSPPFPT